MERFFDDYFIYVVIFVLYILPRLVKFVARSRAERPVSVPRRPDEERPIEAEEEAEFGFPAVDLGLAPVSDSQFDALTARADRGAARARDLADLCRVRGGAASKLTGTVESVAAWPLGDLSEALRARRKAGERLTPEEVLGLSVELDRIDRLIDRLDFMIDRRLKPEWSGILGILDDVAQDALSPYLVHARRVGLDYPTRLAVVVLGEPGQDIAQLLGGTQIAAVVVEESVAFRPRAWIQIPSDAALDLFHSARGLARKLFSDLRVLPVPTALDQYADPRSLVAGLLGGWLPRIFADAGAALALGPGFPAGLAKWLQTASEAEAAVTAMVGDPVQAALPPLHLRMFVGCSVLRYVGREDDAPERWRNWNRQLGEPAAFLVRSVDGASRALPAGPLFDAASHVVDYLMTTPLEPLGGYSLFDIPDLRCDPARIQEMESLAGRFIGNEPVGAPSISVLGAAQLAVERANALEQRIGRSALDAFAGKGRLPQLSAAVADEPSSLAGLLGDPGSLARAVLLGAAVAPRGAGKRRWPAA